MATMRHVLRSRTKLLPLLVKNCQNELGSFQHQGRRLLFTKDFLGMDNYERQRLVTTDRLGDLRDKFCSQMENHITDGSRETVFTDDLKSMLHLVETDEELNTVDQMYRRYLQQGNDLPVWEFNFGPVILRLLIYLNKLELAYQMFTDESLGGTFDNMMCFLLLMDHLYDQGEYKKVLKVFEMVQRKELRGVKYPNDSTTVALAACYKLNTEESFSVMMETFRGCRERGIYFTPRSIYFAAKLSLNQNKPEVAMEVLVTRNDERYITSINLKAIAYARIGRFDDAIRLLQNILNRDMPEQYHRGNEIFKDTIKEIESAVNEVESQEASRELQQVVQRLANGGHISEKSIDDFICQPIIRQRPLQNSFKSRQRSSYTPSYQKYQREGLTDMN